MHSLLQSLGPTLLRLRLGNVAIVAALVLMPLVLAAGYLTDRDRTPGHGISARAGMQAHLSLPDHKG